MRVRGSGLGRRRTVDRRWHLGQLTQRTAVQRSSIDDGMSDVLQKGNKVHMVKPEGYVPCGWAQGVERRMGVAYLQY